MLVLAHGLLLIVLTRLLHPQEASDESDSEEAAVDPKLGMWLGFQPPFA